jgi:hypothetical protein
MPHIEMQEEHIMSRYTRLTSIAFTAASILLLGGPAAAAEDSSVPYESEVNSCIAEISTHANYEDATRVRHTIYEVRRRLGSYVLVIDTAVYTEADDVAAREYASRCTLRGNGKPVRFRISETGKGA